MIKQFYKFLGTILLFSTAAAAPALNSDSGGYGSISDYLDSIYGADDNAGLTAFPVLNVPMGGRSEGMASAFGAVSDDISFLEYNPAGSAMLSRSELAFFHNNWIADTKIEGAVFASRIKNLGLAAGAKWLYTPFSEYNMYGDRVSKGYYSEAAATLNASYNFFSGYYFSGISVGASLKGAFRFMPDYTDNEDHIISGSGWSQSAAMGMADIGALTRFDFLKPYHSRERNTSAALVLRNLGPPVMDEPLPTVVTAALSYKPLRPLLFSFDFSCPINIMDPALSEKPYWAAGAALNITSFLSMRTGLLFKSGNVRVALGSAITLNKISLDINYTLDLLTQMQPLNRISVGIRFDLGDQGRKEMADRVDELYLAGLDAYAQRKYPEAQYYFEEALNLNPKFDPAREGLKIIQHAISVQQRIDDLQRLDF
jgi:tetratricopeptide (TPR) repeat protein